MKTTLLFINKGSHLYNIYLKLSLFISGLLSVYMGLQDSLRLLGILLMLDSVTRIHATAKAQEIKFNPFKKSFWGVIKSKGLKLMLNKAFMQYGIYFFIAFMLDNYILRQMAIIRFQEVDYTLPVVVLWLCIAIEIWSIGENIEDAGGINIPKRIIHFFDEKYQKIFKKENQDDEDKSE